MQDLLIDSAMTHGTTQSMMTLRIQANLSGKNLKISRNAPYFCTNVYTYVTACVSNKKGEGCIYLCIDTREM